MERLAVVIGNTNCRFARMLELEKRDELVVAHGECARGGLAARLRAWWPEGCAEGVICSVVPSLVAVVREALAGYVGEATELRQEEVRWFRLLYDPPSALGADRLCGVIALRELYGGPSMAVDCGTAMTVNVIDASGDFAGGWIAPGAGTALRVLHERTAQLPDTPLRASTELLGRDTEASMRAGVLQQARFAVEGLAAALRGDGEMPVVLTGGNAPLLLQSGLSLQGLRHDPDLLFRGAIFYLLFVSGRRYI